MIAPLAKLIDWSAIQALAMLEPPPHAQGPRLEEALEFLRGPDFIPVESQPAGVEFNPGKSGHFRFSTPRPCSSAENNVVYGRLYRCAENCMAGVMSSIIGTGFRQSPAAAIGWDSTRQRWSRLATFSVGRVGR